MEGTGSTKSGVYPAASDFVSIPITISCLLLYLQLTYSLFLGKPLSHLQTLQISRITHHHHQTAIMSLKYLPIISALLSVALSTPVVTVTASSAPSPTSPSYTDAETFQQDMLTAHNFYRDEHGVEDLVWNETSAEFAADWAEGCRFEHSVSIRL